MKTIKDIKHIITELDKKFGEKLKSLDHRQLLLKNIEIFDFIYNVYSSKATATSNENTIKISEDLLSKTIWDKNWIFNLKGETYAKLYGQFLVHKAGEYRMVQPGNFLYSSDKYNGNAEEKFVNLKINIYKTESVENVEWHIISGNNFLGNTAIVRFYMNFDYSKAADISKFVLTLKDELDNYLVPFKLKFLDKDKSRTDSCVLYVQREHYFITFQVISKILSISNFDTILANETPLFTKKLLNGLGFAEESFDNRFSFGETISNILTVAYLNSYRRKINSDRSNYVIKYLQKKGFRMMELFKNPNTNYPYFFKKFNKKIYKINSDKFYDNKYYAQLIGKIICKQAIIVEHNQQLDIRWLGIFVEDNALSYRIIDDSLLEGRLGIAYFLAKLYYTFPSEFYFKVIAQNLKSIIKPEDKIATIIKNYLELKKLEEIHDDIVIPVDELIKLETIAEQLEKRGILYSTYADEFNPKIKNGYAGFGLRFLTEKDEKILNTLPSYKDLKDKLNFWNYNTNLSSEF